jgi:alkylated DNA repair protein (DNA oxidative demethylase)
VRQDLAPGACLLPGFALDAAGTLLDAAEAVFAAAPPRRWLTPGGRRMAVAMSNCGALGWISDTRGYRYGALDPDSGAPWPAMPAALRELAARAAAAAGFAGFLPDACLLNRYEPGTRLSLHQDRDEQDFTQPIVSVSLGLPAVFLFGGLGRADPVQRLRLAHGDVLVWGGPSRLRYHGVAPLAPGRHERLGALRLNLTFRRAGPT